MLLFPRGHQHHRSASRFRGEGWRWGDSEVPCVIRPHAGHHICMGHRLQSDRLWRWVATLRTCCGRPALWMFLTIGHLQPCRHRQLMMPKLFLRHLHMFASPCSEWRWQQGPENKECPDLARRSLHLYGSDSGGQRHSLCWSQSRRWVPAFFALNDHRPWDHSWILITF